MAESLQLIIRKGTDENFVQVPIKILDEPNLVASAKQAIALLVADGRMKAPPTPAEPEPDWSAVAGKLNALAERYKAELAAANQTIAKLTVELQKAPANE